ncbi:MAG: RNA helicase [Gammaproteobacteria bacterium RIFCSPLOWO2_02_FULL_52_10]|nr:MAG: RNA helicase [Gammaproteobacteria bacterium RIFCSPLOWO2_02_FULL_52_10]OGT86933.1 MAG: RNA helicase [Gammaproteobacteria bacterium RIFCSPLOWO2_12_FULL_52_10]
MKHSETQQIKFKDLPLHEKLHKALDFIKFTHCTPIQAESLPLMLTGKDVAGQAQTGTGKTAAYLLTILQHLLEHPGHDDPGKAPLRALIISPTRELAIQIYNDACLLNKYTDFRIGLVYGGVDYDKQRKMLQDGVDILIGTPGRLIDYYKQKIFSLAKLQIVVLDEADRMFDLGFIRDVRYMFRRMPKPEERQSMLFSATLSWRVTELAYEHMNNPVLIRINPDQITAKNITQIGYHVSSDEKISLLIGLLRRIDPKRTIVFVNTKRTAEQIWGYLEGNGYHSAILSSDVPQQKRQKLFQDFSSGNLPILVATDLASRGLHIPDISHVFNYDMPQNPEDYVHRIGRTARAGASGDAVSLICEEYVYSLHEIEEFIGEKIPTERVEPDMLVLLSDPVAMRDKRPVPRWKNKSKQGGFRQKSSRTGKR